MLKETKVTDVHKNTDSEKENGERTWLAAEVGVSGDGSTCSRRVKNSVSSANAFSFATLSEYVRSGKDSAPGVMYSSFSLAHPHKPSQEEVMEAS